MTPFVAQSSLPILCSLSAQSSPTSIRQQVLAFSLWPPSSADGFQGFTYRISALNTIDLHSTYCVLDYGRFDGIGMKGVIQRLVKELDVSRLVTGKDGNHPGHAPKGEQAAALGEDEPRKEFDTEEGTFPKDAITHRYLWPRVSDFFAEGDIIVSETGTSAFGMWETTFPAKVVAISQVLWG